MTGRNDPCPCGSGKKFKKCCLGMEKSLPSGGGAGRGQIVDGVSIAERPPKIEDRAVYRKGTGNHR